MENYDKTTADFETTKLKIIKGEKEETFVLPLKSEIKIEFSVETDMTIKTMLYTIKIK